MNNDTFKKLETAGRQLSHIEKPYTFEEILDQYLEQKYNPELLLQHLLLLLSKRHLITRKSYNYTCGDGCCDEYGEDWKVDGDFVYSGPNDEDALVAILQTLGIIADFKVLASEPEPGEDQTVIEETTYAATKNQEEA